MAELNFKRVVDGKLYNTKTATLLADDDYWDGHNFTRGGRNTYLYKTPRGRYFTVYTTQWQGERDHLEPISKEEAIEMYEGLPEHHETYETAFDIVPDEA